jgi:ATP-dependent protease ClpP protease subunit
MFQRVVDFYKGQRPFAESFWLYFVALSVLLGSISNILHNLAANSIDWLGYLLTFLLFNVLIYAWQVCGVWRASEYALSSHSSVIWVRGAQIVVIASSLVILSQFMGYVHLSLQDQSPSPIADPPRYSMTLARNDTTLTIDGEVHFGMTHDLSQILDAHQSIQVVVLNSPGGLVAEARGLSMLIRRHQLTTRVDDTCISACTHVYISGTRRLLGPNAKLGFHSYRLDSPYVSIFMDPVTEQRADLALFHQQDVEHDFIERIIATPHHETWFPSHEELLTSGFVHEIEIAPPVTRRK